MAIAIPGIIKTIGSALLGGITGGIERGVSQRIGHQINLPAGKANPYAQYAGPQASIPAAAQYISAGSTQQDKSQGQQMRMQGDLQYNNLMFQGRENERQRQHELIMQGNQLSAMSENGEKSAGQRWNDIGQTFEKHRKFWTYPLTNIHNMYEQITEPPR